MMTDTTRIAPQMDQIYATPRVRRWKNIGWLLRTRGDDPRPNWRTTLVIMQVRQYVTEKIRPDRRNVTRQNVERNLLATGVQGPSHVAEVQMIRAGEYLVATLGRTETTTEVAVVEMMSADGEVSEIAVVLILIVQRRGAVMRM